MHRLFWLVPLNLLLLLGAGCGTRLAPVSGTVTLDGQPLADGVISIRPLPALAASEGIGGSIQNGKYELRVPPGHSQVAISASRVVPGKGTDPWGNPLKESIIPDRYNGKSTLTVDVSPSGPNQFNFDLTSQ